ncbi:hypothetical protein CAAN1_01S04500 [[Candida] anglica]|uniref:SEC7 domain-containing protein n=1 Tax=[Candida] anglica TaxID=148631 RepID=A0ABP0EJI6_9ASCO
MTPVTDQTSSNTFVSTTSRQDYTPPTTPPSPSRSTEKFQTPTKSSTNEEDLHSNDTPKVDLTTTATNETEDSTNNSTAAEAEHREIASKLFKEEFVSIQPEEYTQFLAANDAESTSIREYYMDLFDWNANLLKSTRMLCSKLYLKGESQEIDRILSSFTKSYIKQHPTNVFCTRNFEKIYIVLYSLILLNTALHNSELNKKSKISQADYIKNTFNTFIQQNPKSSKKLTIKQRITIERVLSTYYEDLSKNELHLKQSDEPTTTDHLHSPKQKEKRKNRVSIVESVSSFVTSNHQNSSSATASTTNTSNTHASNHHNHSHRSASNSTSTSGVSNNNGNGATSASASHPLPPLPHDHTNEFPTLSRQISGSSIWSTDTNGNRRQSLSMKRMSTTSSAVSSYTAANTSSSTLGSTRTARVGFTRALLSDQNNQKYYQNADARLGNIPYTVRNRNSLNQLRGAPQQPVSNTLNKRSSRASIISKESGTSLNGDDTLSVLSLDTFKIHDMDFDEDHHRQHLDDFNVDDYQDQYDLTLELQGSPYLKEGLLRLKILHNDQLDNSTTNSTEISQPNVPEHQTATGRFFSFFSKSHNTSKESTSAGSTTAGTSNSHVTSRFVENFVVVSKGEMSLYSFDPKVIKKHQHKLKKMHQEIEEDDDDNIGDGNWLKNAANIGNYNLCSTFAQLEKQNSSTAKKVLWSLTFPKISKKLPKKFIFEAGTTEIALEFINTCNFWASKITAIPTMEESVSSIEYGWNNLDELINHKDNFKKMKNIQKWEQLPQGTFLSNYMVVNNEMNSSQDNHLGMMKQFVRTLNYYNNLKKTYKDFNILRNEFTKNFNVKGIANSSNYHRVLGNYDIKNEHYKFELNKYKNYLIVLGFGLQLRFDMEEQDKETNLSGDGEDSEGNKVNESPKESDLSLLVKSEIGKLFINMKDIGKIIPTFQSSRSLNNLSEIRRGNAEDPNSQFPLVKSPKTFTLSNYKDDESPITQLIQSSNQAEAAEKEVVHSHSTNTIREEEEPDSDSGIGEIPDASLSAISLTGSIKSVNPTTLNVAKAHIVKVT